MLPFCVHRWMHITVQSNLYIRMAQHLAETLYIDSFFNAISGKSFIEYFSKKKCRETIGEYRTSNKDTFASELNQGIRDNKNKRVIVYQLIKDN